MRKPATVRRAGRRKWRSNLILADNFERAQEKNNIKENKTESDNSFQSGPNLMSFAFNRGGRM